ncbi:hypothetical protein [Gracilimonas mengyeensis]|uniref:Outer membrane protein beta-barrel domain-containing protein n=1 Tax=Gracilimonas mengyeensis TaxID=1302730 RepID=A0A521BFN6_9BACT|nr:hypothetical protein [Gracilimonas mengyeensis]SMO45872.1 hypothetical protein SAMN06265219_102256 [Gracilimonas mengyeensis]
MKKSLILTLLSLFCFFGTQTLKAQDGFFSNAKTLEQGTFAVGIQPVMLTAQDDFMFITRGAYGFSNDLTGHAKLGFMDDEIYFGGHFEANVASEPTSSLSVALLGGIYTYGDLGLKTGVNISKDIHPVSLYTGFNYQPLFTDNVTYHALLVPVGIDIHLNDAPVDLMLEGNIPVNDEAEYLEALTFGARIYLN